MSERSYDLIARLGRGGMGVVDLARDENGNKVALKRLTLQGSASEIARARQRLLREADVLRKLHHPNVVGLLDVIDEGDEIVLVMPYMSGGSLAERVAQHGPAPADEVERQARRLVGALASAHAAGIVHRDIKPANVLFDERGEPCLADFGVAISRDHTHGLTVAGMVVGTPGFMAPEQARGEAVSPATDVFSLGATLLFAATGDGPFGQGDPGLLMVRAAGGKVEKVPRSLPGSLRTLLRRMLHPRPERRPTAAELAVEGSRTAAVRAAIAERRPDAGPRAWAAVGAGAAAVALVAGGLALNASRDGTSVDSPADTPAADGDAATEAPGTDGDRCVDDHDDYDGLAENGCEAVPDDQDGRTLETTIEANIVPRDDVDRYPLHVDDTMQLLCDGTVEILLEAPTGMSLSLELVDRDGAVVGDAIATPDAPAVVTLGEEQCGADDKTMFEVVVRAAGGERVADDYVLTRRGDF